MPVRMVGAFFLGVAVALLAVAGSHGQNTPPPSRITPRFGHYLQPAISGDTVVWFDGRRGSPLGRIPGIDIYGRSLRTGREFRVTSSPTADYASSLMVSGQTVVWDDCRHCRQVNGLPGYAGDQIFMRNIATGREFPLPLRVYGQLGPWLLSGLAVWGRQPAHGPVKFYAADSVSGRPRPLATDPVFRQMLARRDHLVVWRDSYDLRAGDLLTGRTYILARHAPDEGPLTDPIISGQRVIWTRWPPEAPVSIDGFDLATGKHFRVATLPANHYDPQFGPDKTIIGHVVVWVQTRNVMSSRHPDYTLMDRDITSQQSFRLSTGPREQGQPAVSGNRLVYVDDRSDAGRRLRSLVLERRLSARAPGVDPIWPMQFRGGD